MLAPLLIYTILGLAIGSFLNVCIYRIPRRSSVVRPGSRCPECDRPIRPYDNVPVLSYLWLRGRCRNCGTRIPFRYPLVELVTGAAFFACASVWEFEPPTFVNSLFLSLIIALVFIDYDHQILPNVLTLPGALAGLALAGFQAPELVTDRWVTNPWLGSAIGAAAGALPLFAVRSGYYLLRRVHGMGLGDLKLMAMVGAFLGWRLALLTIAAGSLLGSLVGVFLILFRGRNFKTALPFGTFLGPGAALALFGGNSFLHWYAARL